MYTTSYFAYFAIKEPCDFIYYLKNTNKFKESYPLFVHQNTIYNYINNITPSIVSTSVYYIGDNVVNDFNCNSSEIEQQIIYKICPSTCKMIKSLNKISSKDCLLKREWFRIILYNRLYLLKEKNWYLLRDTPSILNRIVRKRIDDSYKMQLKQYGCILVHKNTVHNIINTLFNILDVYDDILLDNLKIDNITVKSVDSLKKKLWNFNTKNYILSLVEVKDASFLLCKENMIYEILDYHNVIDENKWNLSKCIHIPNQLIFDIIEQTKQSITCENKDNFYQQYTFVTQYYHNIRYIYNSNNQIINQNCLLCNSPHIFESLEYRKHKWFICKSCY